MENEKVCRNCEHACHCDTVVCEGDIFAGMTDKVFVTKNYHARLSNIQQILRDCGE